MATGLFGYFSFRLKGNDLDGDYFNNQSIGLFPETAVRTSSTLTSFNGNFISSYKDGTKNKTAVLTIRAPNPNRELLLEWIENGTGCKYEGKGIDKNGELVGYYHRL